MGEAMTPERLQDIEFRNSDEEGQFVDSGTIRQLTGAIRKEREISDALAKIVKAAEDNVLRAWKVMEEVEGELRAKADDGDDMAGADQWGEKQFKTWATKLKEGRGG